MGVALKFARKKNPLLSDAGYNYIVKTMARDYMLLQYPRPQALFSVSFWRAWYAKNLTLDVL